MMSSQLLTTKKHSTANPYEEKFGYSRAVRRGQFIFVSGTTSIEPQTGEVLHPHSAFDQTITIFSEIIKAVEALGGARDDIMRVRMFVTDADDAEDVGKGMKTMLGAVAPAATMIIGSRFISPKMKVEIEADAVVTWYVLLLNATQYLKVLQGYRVPCRKQSRAGI